MRLDTILVSKWNRCSNLEPVCHLIRHCSVNVCCHASCRSLNLHHSPLPHGQQGSQSTPLCNGFQRCRSVHTVDHLTHGSKLSRWVSAEEAKGVVEWQGRDQVHQLPSRASIGGHPGLLQRCHHSSSNPICCFSTCEGPDKTIKLVGWTSGIW